MSTLIPDPSNAAALLYFAPLPNFTGHCQSQPKPADTRTAWYFDAALNYQETGFLDAPNSIPTGAVRGLDINAVCLGIATQLRGGGA